ncbi:anoctamin-7-like [Dysidea avara]|uniref:anoctamin-7-like n=1 Tax=Dysidea avara TaxID=196820 RepID=UPI0033326CDA
MAYPNISGEDSTFNVELTENNNQEAPQRRQIGYDQPTPRKSTESAKLLVSDDGTPRPRLNTAERKEQEETIFFEDGKRRIDYILTYTIADKERDEKHADDQDKRKRKRETFLGKFDAYGLEYETQDCSESPDRVTFFVKVHARWEALLEGAEKLNLRMPFQESTLREFTWRERFFDKIKVEDPLLPKIDKKYEIRHYLTAPFRLDNKDNYIGIKDQETFFSSAQRSLIVRDILQSIQYGKDEDQVGIGRLISNHSFSKGFPLHDGQYSCGKEEDIDCERKLLYYHWSKWTNFYKSQPLNHVRKYFGEKIGIYFTWVGFYTEWLMFASFVGFVVMLYGFSTIPTHRNALADDICNSPREEFFMCPLCDERCDFWYYRDTCSAAGALFLFDNGGTVFFAAFMALWAVFFLEFWKRRQFVLQHDWDVLGYEDAEQRSRPEFEHEIKRKIRKLESEGRALDAKKYKQFNPVYEKDELVQPDTEYLAKVGTAFSVLVSMVMIVIAIVFAVLLYRLAVAGALYRAVQNVNGGPSGADFVVLLTGSLLQLVGILVMNKLYEYFAVQLTNWELHRTQTEFDDNFIAKMYVFQFVNFYSSIFYIAFFKGNFTGYPGNYQRIGVLRLDECSTYGCLLELTIQLSVVMLGKQTLNNFVELGVPYTKRLIAWWKRKEETEEDVFTRWEKDFELPPLSRNGLFEEYLELVIQFGFITIFVAAFPLAPLFAWLNNIIEIRLDAFKFVSVLQRPIAERAQDIGAWYAILDIIARLSVVTNAFLIAVTAQFIPLQVYSYRDPAPDLRRNSPAWRNDNLQKSLGGYVAYSITPFPIEALLNDSNNPFPLPTAIALNFYFNNSDDPSDFYYQPYHTDYTCFLDRTRFRIPANISDFACIADCDTDSPEIKPYFKEESWKRFRAQNPLGPGDRFRNNYTECVNTSYPCRYRGLREPGGSFREFYWITWTCRLAFVVCFEHVIFVLGSILAYLVPDVPASVQREIKKEKLLAYEAIHSRISANAPNVDIEMSSTDTL